MRERKEGRDDEKTQDAVKLKFMEAFECRRDMRMESEGRRMRGAQVGNKLSMRSAPRRSRLSICQEVRAEQAAPTHFIPKSGGQKTERRMGLWRTTPSNLISFNSFGWYK